MALSNAERKRNYRRRQKVKLGLDPDTDLRGKHGNQAKGKDNGRWNDERITSSHGYVKVRVGREHPLADPNGYAYEHLIVWLAAGRQKPAPDEVLHHKNHDKSDNRLTNLELKSRPDHGAEHIAERKRDEKGRILPIGKKKAGRLLDGREWNEYPNV